MAHSHLLIYSKERTNGVGWSEMLGGTFILKYHKSCKLPMFEGLVS